MVTSEKGSDRFGFFTPKKSTVDAYEFNSAISPVRIDTGNTNNSMHRLISPLACEDDEFRSALGEPLDSLVTPIRPKMLASLMTATGSRRKYQPSGSISKMSDLEGQRRKMSI